MSYYGTAGPGLPGFTEGMGASFPGAGDRARTPNEGLRSIQQALQRMGIPAAPAAPLVADGLWGIYTAAALGLARRSLGRTAPPFSTTNAGRLITIPDDFIAAIQAAATAAVPTALTVPLPPGPDPSATPPPPAPLPGMLPTPEAMPLPPVVAPPSRTRLYLMIGGAVVVLGGVATYALWPAKKSTPNRRRHVRRNRRRRTSRR